MKLILKHAGAWMLFIIYECGMLLSAGFKLGGLFDLVPFYVLNISLFYLNACFTLPAAFAGKNKFLRGVGLVLLEITLYLLGKRMIDDFENFQQPAITVKSLMAYVIPNLWRSIYFIALSTFYWGFLRVIAYRRMVAESEKKELIAINAQILLQKDLAESRNAYLQQQLNPHSMLNALNFVYNTIYKYSPEASQCILLLAEIQRYILKAPDINGKVDLFEEIAQINNLMAINRLRYDYDLFISFEQNISAGDHKIIPLVLFTFVENVFKHGNLKDRFSPATISLEVSDACLLKFATQNRKSRKSSWERIKSIGIENTIKRLNYSYPDNFDLDVNDMDNDYLLTLTIQL